MFTKLLGILVVAAEVLIVGLFLVAVNLESQKITLESNPANPISYANSDLVYENSDPHIAKARIGDLNSGNKGVYNVEQVPQTQVYVQATPTESDLYFQGYPSVGFGYFQNNKKYYIFNPDEISIIGGAFNKGGEVIPESAYEWYNTINGGRVFISNGSYLRVHVPENACTLEGADISYTLKATNSKGLSSENTLSLHINNTDCFHPIGQ